MPTLALPVSVTERVPGDPMVGLAKATQAPVAELVTVALPSVIRICGA